MDNEYKPIGERVAVLEVQMPDIQSDLKTIKENLSELLELKSKGMGALWFVSLIVGSGLLGLIVTVLGFFSRPHL